ncbi:hypothetical protein HGRIS_003886 [Hohenbuehelia grisea]|uniref:DNA2/NAM7 helicase-like C-terminal domain-containing protein n=1 Tax=Hohenbuehelia grisea TaxID=104357 RepID=A0ABR3JHY9_9AGAR
MPPAHQLLWLEQNLIDTSESQPIAYITVSDTALSDQRGEKIIAPFRDYPKPLGISYGYLHDLSKLTAVAISTDKKCLIVEFTEKSDAGTGRKVLETGILCRDLSSLLAFDCGPLAIYLYSNFKLRMAHAVDIQSAFPTHDPTKRKSALQAVEALTGDQFPIFDTNIETIFADLVYDPRDLNNTHKFDIVQRAWLSQFLATLGNAASTFDSVSRIDTRPGKIPDVELDAVAKSEFDARRRDRLRPTTMEHEFSAGYDARGKHMVAAKSTNYKSRIRPHTDLEVTIATPNGSYTMKGQAGEVLGQTANLSMAESVNPQTIAGLRTTSRRGTSTMAEAKRSQLTLHVLQGRSKSFSNPWLRNLFLDHAVMTWPEAWASSSLPPHTDNHRNLNQQSLNSSQLAAVNTMLSSSSDNHIVLIQGPPGTGKTSVIANYVKLAITNHQTGIWLIAQSNVAVKNIAEKLSAYGFNNYRLLVSDDFKHEWHDHLYHQISDNLVMSSDFPKYSSAKLQDCQVVLCTLSMLSNPFISRFTIRIPIQTLVVDEASQIDIGDYMAIFPKFPSLRKVCFIGDNKQLPPHGNDTLKDLRSIFELDHLAAGTMFLNTQYRMPPQMGGFISTHVYDERLLSNKLHPIPDTIQACFFINVANGSQQFANKSFKNDLECDMVLQIAKILQDLNKSYRIITPYEAQTSNIETRMKVEDMHWHNKCFNIDSFQGNEDDFIIISLVRSRDLGFLKQVRRTNVMLTRFKKGMFIVSNKKFVEGAAADTLAGKLAQHLGDRAWLDMKDFSTAEILTK